MFTIGLTAAVALLITAVIFLGLSFNRQPHAYGRGWRTGLIGLWCVILLILLGYSIWPLSPMGQTQADRLAENFMTALSAGEHEAALDMTTGYWVGADYQKIANQFRDPSSRPISWELSGLDSRDRVIGTAAFSDGVELIVAIGFEWRWEKARWGISLVDFDRSRILFALYHRFPSPKDVTAALVGIAAMTIFGGIWRLKQAKSMKQE